MAYHQFTNETGEAYGSFETFFYYDAIGSEHPFRLGDRGWYWQACFPGCFPEGDLNGPFETEAEAVANAND